MLILLPPSQTKAPGGTGAPLRLESLRFADQLTAARTRAIDWLRTVSHDDERARRALRLTARQLAGLADNRAVMTAPTMPAMERFTGVLAAGLDAASLDASARERLSAQVLVQTSLFGLIGASDAIPDYHLAVHVPKRELDLEALWGPAGAAALMSAAGSSDQEVLDLRSKAYVTLTPVPPTVRSVWVDVVGADGARSLNHFNKRWKGLLVRAIAQCPNIRRLEDVDAAARTIGARFSLVGDRSARLIVPS